MRMVSDNFYNEVSITKTKDKTLFHSRIILLKAGAIVIQNGLRILNIKTPNRM